jgi:DNA-binding CsgD family transcriptional regulator
LVRETLPAGPRTAPGDTWFRTGVALQRVAARLALDAEDLAGARAWLEAHDHWHAWSGAVLGLAVGQLGWSAYHRAAGDLDVARAHAEAALACAAEPRQPLALLAAHRTLGELDTAVGQHAAAQEHLDAALSLADACATPYERALALLALAELRAAAGDRRAAETLLAEVRTTSVPLGAAPALARAGALAARLAAAPASYPAGLTTREVEVLRLLVGGASNRAIAATLFLSLHTVERHVANLYAKTGAHGRAAATAFALRHHLA